MDAFSVIKFPLTTESAMKKIEDNNTLVRTLCALRALHALGALPVLRALLALHVLFALLMLLCDGRLGGVPDWDRREAGACLGGSGV